MSSADRVGAVPLRTSDDTDSNSSGQNGASSGSAPSAAAAAASPFRSPTKITERWMSFSWFIGLHVPILLGLCTGNTTLARSMWPESFFDDPEADARASQAAGNINRPVPRSIPAIYGAWYPCLFFLTLALTACFYFGTALSYPGYVGPEYRKRMQEQEEAEAEAGTSTDGSSRNSPRARNGYSRVHEIDARSSPRDGGGNDDVRLDIHAPHVRRILVGSSSEQQQQASYDSSSTARLSPRSLARSAAMPASALGEAEEAAELSIGCAPPLAQPIMRSLGIGRAQLHASDQTEDEESKQSLDQNGERDAAASEAGDIELSTLHDSTNSNGDGAAGSSSAASSPGSLSAPVSIAAISRACGYCSLCKLVKPARAKHCYKCKQCIQKFDHHCPWVANCIGRANHRYFLTYCLLQTAAMLWGISLNLDPFFHDPPLSAWYSHSALMLLMVLQLMVCSMLGCFHCWLSVTNQTTYHVIKMQDDEKARQPGGDTPARRQARREATRRRGEVSSDDDDDDHASAAADASGILANLPAAPALTTQTYHEGYCRNIVHFWQASIPAEHALPRSILIDGRWRHLPHAIYELREITERITGREETPPPTLRRVEIAAMRRDYNAEAADERGEGGSNGNAAPRSTIVHMQWDGSSSSGNGGGDSEAHGIPDTPPLIGRDVYTRPVRVLGHCKVPTQRAQPHATPPKPDQHANLQQPPPMELDTDEDPDAFSSTSVRL